MEFERYFGSLNLLSFRNTAQTSGYPPRQPPDAGWKKELEEAEMKTFETYMAGLATTSASKLATRDDFAFCGSNMVPEALKEEFRTFSAAWQDRFGIKNVITQVSTAGWYLFRVWGIKRLGVYNRYPAHLRTTFNVWVNATLKTIEDDWEQTFPGCGDEALVVVRVEIDPRFGPWVAEATRPMSGKSLGLFYRQGFWLLEDGHGFSVWLPEPGSIPFQRAARIMETNHLCDWETTVILLEWVMAAGRQNALWAADDALSKRKSETMSSARAIVRAAIA